MLLYNATVPPFVLTQSLQQACAYKSLKFAFILIQATLVLPSLPSACNTDNGPITAIITGSSFVVGQLTGLVGVHLKMCVCEGVCLYT